jgi:hypothetical protein
LSEETALGPYVLEILRLEALEKWDEVDQLCAHVSELARAGRIEEFPHEVWHFLSDYDIRQRDPEYGVHQRSEIRSLLGL